MTIGWRNIITIMKSIKLPEINSYQVKTAIIFFLLVLVVYFGVGTKWTFIPRWGLDYFNPLAGSILHGRLDLSNVGTNYDLSNYQGKWYAPWGILPALILVPVHLVMGRYIPIFYLTIFFSGLNTAVLYLILYRIKKEFIPSLSKLSLVLFTFLFAFGTTHFYVGTIPSVWQVEQIISVFPTLLGVYFISKKKRKTTDYLISTIAMCIALLGKANLVLLGFLPAFLYVSDRYAKKKFLVNAIIVFGLPLTFFSGLFFTYNYIRFSNPFESGYHYINESSHFAKIRQENGVWSIKTIPRNFWYMTLEMPSLRLDGNKKINLNFNLEGNSIFFLTPPLLAIFLATPVNSYIVSLWLTLLVSLIPILMYYSTGWMQFGYRYSLDFLILLLLLSVFGTKGKITLIFILGVIFSVWMHILGIKALQ